MPIVAVLVRSANAERLVLTTNPLMARRPPLSRDSSTWPVPGLACSYLYESTLKVVPDCNATSWPSSKRSTA